MFAFQGCVGAVLFTIVSRCNESGADGGGWGALKHIQVPAYFGFLGCSMVLFPASTFQEIHVIGKREASLCLEAVCYWVGHDPYYRRLLLWGPVMENWV